MLRSQVTSLRPLAHFPKLRDLIASVNPIDDASGVEGLAHLKRVVAASTQIRDVRPFGGPPPWPSWS